MPVSDLSPIQAITARLVTSHPANWGYTVAAYTGNLIEGVASFNLSNDMNVPLDTSTDTNPNTLNWGLQTQGASIARRLLNHMFGRMSYNIRKVTDQFYSFMSLEKRQWALNALKYDPDQAYYQNDVCFTIALVSGVQLMKHWIRTSSSPLTITGVDPTAGGSDWTLVQDYSGVFPQQPVNAPGYKRSFGLVDLTGGGFLTTTWYPVVSSPLGASAVVTPQDSNTILTEFEAYVSGFVTGQANACRASLSATVKTGGWNVASGFDSAAYPTSAVLNNQTFIDDVTGADLGIANSPIGFTMMPLGKQVVYWLRGGSKYGVWNSFGASFSVKTASYNNGAGDPAISPQLTRQFAYNPLKQYGRFAVPLAVLGEDAVNKSYIDALYDIAYPSAGATLTKNRVNRITSSVRSVVLPVGVVDGEYVEIDASEASVTITQGTANDLVRMPGNGGSTKGLTGKTIIPAGFYGVLRFFSTWFALVSPVKITDPVALPGGNGQNSAWSPDGRYLAIAHSVTPFVTIYDWSTGVPVKIANPATLPANDGSGVAWSPDGRYLAVSHTGSPSITIYDWITGVPIKIANPATLPAGDGTCCAWSPDNIYLAVGSASTPFVTIYSWITGAPVKIANPATLPAGQVNGIAWTADARFMACAHSVTPFVTIYEWATGVPVSITAPATLPTGTGSGAGWSPDGRYLAIIHGVTPFVSIYDFLPAANAQTKIANPATLPAGNGLDGAWSPDGRYLAVFHQVTPFVTIYDFITGVPVKITNPVAIPSADAQGGTWSPNGRYLVTVYIATPFIIIYDWAVAASNAWKLIPTRILPGGLGTSTTFVGRLLYVTYLWFMRTFFR